MSTWGADFFQAYRASTYLKFQYKFSSICSCMTHLGHLHTTYMHLTQVVGTLALIYTIQWMGKLKKRYMGSNQYWYQQSLWQSLWRLYLLSACGKSCILVGHAYTFGLWQGNHLHSSWIKWAVQIALRSCATQDQRFHVLKCITSFLISLFHSPTESSTCINLWLFLRLYMTIAIIVRTTGSFPRL